MKRQVIEDVGIIGGLIGVQFVYAGNSILQSYLMSVGLNPFNIIIFSTFATFLILSPIAFYFERSKWPKKFSFKLLIQLLLIAFGGVTLFQSLLPKGIKLTSPAMPNLASGLIFVIAWTLRLEKVKLSCTYSKVKIVEAMVCVGGALTMSIMHSAATSATASERSLITSAPPTHNILFDNHKIIGCLYLLEMWMAMAMGLQVSFNAEKPLLKLICMIYYYM